jgi:hypothetical protein
MAVEEQPKRRQQRRSGGQEEREPALGSIQEALERLQASLEGVQSAVQSLQQEVSGRLEALPQDPTQAILDAVRGELQAHWTLRAGTSVTVNCQCEGRHEHRTDTERIVIEPPSQVEVVLPSASSERGGGQQPPGPEPSPVERPFGPFTGYAGITGSGLNYEIVVHGPVTDKTQLELVVDGQAMVLSHATRDEDSLVCSVSVPTTSQTWEAALVDGDQRYVLDETRFLRRPAAAGN